VRWELVIEGSRGGLLDSILRLGTEVDVFQLVEHTVLLLWRVSHVIWSIKTNFIKFIKWTTFWIHI